MSVPGRLKKSKRKNPTNQFISTSNFNRFGQVGRALCGGEEGSHQDNQSRETKWIGPNEGK